MTIYKNTYRIESARLRGYDYSQPGEYFVTICTGGMVEWFGKVVDGENKRNDIGEITRSLWMKIPEHHQHTMLDEFIVMPNHVHGIIVLCENNHGRDAINRVSTGGKTKTHNPMLSCDSLSYIIRQYKGRVSFEIHKTQPDFTWQSRFHDRIIRDEKELNAIHEYIVNNPMKWLYDNENPIKGNNPLSDK